MCLVAMWTGYESCELDSSYRGWIRGEALGTGLSIVQQPSQNPRRASSVAPPDRLVVWGPNWAAVRQGYDAMPLSHVCLLPC